MIPHVGSAYKCAFSMRCCQGWPACLPSALSTLAGSEVAGWQPLSRDFPAGSDGKASACNVVDRGSIPELGRSPGEGSGNLLQHSCLENPMDGGAWWTTVHGVAKSQTRLSDFTFTFSVSPLAAYRLQDKAQTPNSNFSGPPCSEPCPGSIDSTSGVNSLRICPGKPSAPKAEPMIRLSVKPRGRHMTQAQLIRHIV